MSLTYKSTTKSGKYTMFPVKPEHQSLYKFYKNHLSTFWTIEEVRLPDDINDWKFKLNDDTKFFIKNVLAFFAASDGIVNENLVVNFYNEVEIPVARSFYTVQMMIESIHSEMYSILIDTFVTEKQEKEDLFNAIETIPAIKKKAEWAIKWISNGQTPNFTESQLESLKDLQGEFNSGALTNDYGDNYGELLSDLLVPKIDFSKRLLAFVCVEGIFFSGSFCAIYWLKDRGLMPGLAKSNKFISRDENLHTEFAIELYKVCFSEDNRLDAETVHEIFREAVDIEKEFITESLPVSLLGMNCKLMSEYIECVCDRWLVLLDYPKIYNTRNPFEFMDRISLETKENFFDGDVTEYGRAGVGKTEAENSFSLNEDF